MSRHSKAKLTLTPRIINEGRDAYNAGVTTVEQAKAANPYRGFGEFFEHARFVSWNTGWNEAKRVAETMNANAI